MQTNKANNVEENCTVGQERKECSSAKKQNDKSLLKNLRVNHQQNLCKHRFNFSRSSKANTSLTKNRQQTGACLSEHLDRTKYHYTINGGFIAKSTKFTKRCHSPPICIGCERKHSILQVDVQLYRVRITKLHGHSSLNTVKTICDWRLQSNVRQ